MVRQAPRSSPAALPLMRGENAPPCVSLYGTFLLSSINPCPLCVTATSSTTFPTFWYSVADLLRVGPVYMKLKELRDCSRSKTDSAKILR